MAKPLRIYLFFTAKLAFSGLLLWLVVSRLDVAGIGARLRAADWRWLAAAVALNPVIMALAARRWQGLSLGLLRFGVAFRYCWIGLFFGSIVPGMVSGDVAKGVALAAKEARARDERLPISILADKLIGLWMLCVLFCSAAAFLLLRHPAALAGLRGIFAGSVGAVLGGLALSGALLRPAGIKAGRRMAALLPFAAARSFAARALDALSRYASEPRLLGLAAALSLAIHLLNSLSFWLVLQSLGIPAGLDFAAVVYPLLSVLLSVPISVSGIGVRDAFLLSLFRAFGLNPESGVAFSWLLLGVSIPIVAAGGLIQLGEVFRRRRT